MRLPFTFKKLFLTISRGSRIIITLAIIDQVTKWWFISYLRWKPGLTIKITSFLDMVYSWNYGISFGMLRNYYQYSNNLFIVINSAIVSYLYYIMLKTPTATSFAGYSFVIGGAVGNLVDRFFRGAVFDFIHFHYHDYSFPIFNLADSFISLGVLLILKDYYNNKKLLEEDKQAKYDESLIEAEAERIRQQHDKASENMRF